MSSPESITRVEVRDEPRPGLRVAPARVGRYEIGHRLGQGGAGIVYSARDPELQRDVAVKIITLRSGAQDEAARLVREGQALAQLSHENVVRVFDVGFHDARTVYLVMEQLDGGDLRKWLATPRSVDEIVAACTAAGRGLAAVHAIGVVHRDFKPSNVLVGKDGRIAVGDFGLAKSFERAASSEPSERNSGESLRFDDDLTGTGSVVGTPAFMAPEQHTGGEVGPAADQFAFCVSFWLALFGTYPFEGRSLPELAANKLAGRIATAPRRSGVPRQVVAVLARGLAAQPEARHPGMDAMLSALADAFSVPRRRTGGLAIAAGVAVLLGGVAFVTARPQCEDASERMAGVWDAAVRADIEAALDRARTELRTQNALHGVVPRLDAWAASWIDARNQACAIASAGGRSDSGTMRCLDRRADAFADVVAMMRESTGATGMYAADLADAIPAVTACDRPDRSDAWADHGERRVEIDDELRRLDQARALAIANRPAEARSIAEAVEQRATELDYAPLRAMSGTLLARLDRDIGEMQAAADRLLASIAIAEEHGLDRLVADAGIVLIAVLAYEMQRPDEAEFWRRRTEVAITRAGGDPERYSDFQAALATIHGTRFDIPAARDAMVRAVASAQSDRQRQGHLGLLCSFEASLDQHEAAAQHCAEAIGLASERVGIDHPDLAGLLGNYASALMVAGEYRRAADELQRAVAMVERSHGPTHRQLPSLLALLADALQAAGGADEEALAIARRAVALTAEQVGEDHPLYADEIEDYGRLLGYAGRPAEAIAPIEKALRIREASFGPDHPRLAITLHDLGDTMLEVGRAKDAVAQLRRSHALLDRMPEFEMDDAEVRFCLGRALWEAGDRREALTLARGAMLDLARGGEAQISADAYLWLAEHERR